jgi:hypothetical protein
MPTIHIIAEHDAPVRPAINELAQAYARLFDVWPQNTKESNIGKPHRQLSFFASMVCENGDAENLCLVQSTMTPRKKPSRGIAAGTHAAAFARAVDSLSLNGLKTLEETVPLTNDQAAYVRWRIEALEYLAAVNAAVATKGAWRARNNNNVSQAFKNKVKGLTLTKLIAMQRPSAPEPLTRAQTNYVHALINARRRRNKGIL